ncbi:MAG: class I SAM-dependent methyltransferase [Myxococcales bacterium]|nr:class I SAM-dependent methyltransferase [Myxococcales bacterium]
MRRVGCLLFLAACGPSTKPEPAAPAHAAHGHGGHHGAMHHRFDDPAAWSLVFDDPARDAWQRPADVVVAMRITSGMTVADLGAGTGYFLSHLSTAVGPSGRVLALDVEPKLVAHMKERAHKAGWSNVEAREIPTDDPKLPDASVDRILVVDTWHHVENRKAYATKLWRALRPGGAVFVVDFTLTSDKGPPKALRLSPEQVIGELTAAGLSAKVLPVGLPDQYVIEGARP